jgi:POT family proton-dependent oligopeptide transporter
MGHPPGLATLFFTEMWERFSFYGMRALLVLFLTAAVVDEGMGLKVGTATAIYGLYMAGVYLTALPGGWIADRLIGAQRSVLVGGIIIACGHFTLALSGLNALPSDFTFFAGLVLIVCGTGLLKPNTSALVGTLYPQDQGSRRDAGFSIYYMGINIGSVLGTVICGWLGQKVNWHYGFGAAGVGMVLGLVAYVITQRFLGENGRRPKPAFSDPARQKRYLGFSWTLLWIAVAIIIALVALGYIGVIHYEPRAISKWTSGAILILGLGFLAWIFFFGELDTREKKRVTALAILFLATTLFWAGYEQSGSSFNLFAERFTDLSIFGFSFPASWFQTENPALIILLSPFFAWLWVWLGRRNMDPNTPLKFAIGLVFVGFGFLVMMGAELIVVTGATVLPTWLALTYLLHTIGELFLSPVSLSVTTKLSPQRFSGRLMGTLFLFMALAESLAGLVASHLAGREVAGSTQKFHVEDLPHNYLIIAITIIAVGVLLALLSPLIQRKLIGRDLH